MYAVVGYQATTAQTFIACVQRKLSDSGSEYGLNARTLGNVVYFMSSLNTGREVLKVIESAVLAALGTKS
jgi:adenosylmethionine-8-amino-7-oxononanoate aminotransferase